MEKMEKITTQSAKETYELGWKMAKVAKQGEVYALVGDLGTGKTVFSQGFAAGLGIERPITSPTFIIVNEYEEGRLPFFHFDVYRLTSGEELEALGFDDYLNRQGVVLMEWANNVADVLDFELTLITLSKEFAKGEDYRQVTIQRGKNVLE